MQRPDIIYTHSKNLFFLIFTLSQSLIYTACKKQVHDAEVFKPYSGPLAVMEKVHMLYSDSAIVKVELNADKQEEYFNGDRVFPEGMYLQFFDNDGTVNATLTSNQAKYTKQTGIYTVWGNVIITGVKEYKKINTEELNWNPATRKVYTEKFVRIETREEILTGNGLDATQDFKYYKILNPTGVFSVKQ